MQGFVGKHLAVRFKSVRILEGPDHKMSLTGPFSALIAERTAALRAKATRHTGRTRVLAPRLPNPFNLMIKPANPCHERRASCPSAISTMAVGDKFGCTGDGKRRSSTLAASDVGCRLFH